MTTKAGKTEGGTRIDFTPEEPQDEISDNRFSASRVKRTTLCEVRGGEATDEAEEVSDLLGVAVDKERISR